MGKKKGLVIGIPNGSLYDATMELLKKVGMEIRVNGRSFEAEISGSKIFNRALIMRPQIIPDAIIGKVIDCGICGLDCVIESGHLGNLVKVTELKYSKKTREPVRVVVFSKRHSLRDRPNITVSAEYPNLAKEIFKKAKIVFSYGTTEANVVADLYDYGVGVTESGKSLDDNGLFILKTVLVSPTVLMALSRYPDEVAYLGKLLNGVLLAEESILIKMDVLSEADLDNVLAVLPSDVAPTVSELGFKKGYAVESVINSRDVSDLISKLEKRGAKSILVMDIKLKY